MRRRTSGPPRSTYRSRCSRTTGSQLSIVRRGSAIASATVAHPVPVPQLHHRSPPRRRIQQRLQLRRPQRRIQREHIPIPPRPRTSANDEARHRPRQPPQRLHGEPDLAPEAHRQLSDQQRRWERASGVSDGSGQVPPARAGQDAAETDSTAIGEARTPPDRDRRRMHGRGWRARRPLPAVVGEGFVGLRHAVDVVLALPGAALLLRWRRGSRWRGARPSTSRGGCGRSRRASGRRGCGRGGPGPRPAPGRWRRRRGGSGPRGPG